jgi:hypothetical protein
MHTPWPPFLRAAATVSSAANSSIAVDTEMQRAATSHDWREGGDALVVVDEGADSAAEPSSTLHCWWHIVSS